MRDQHAFGNAGGVVVIDALDLETEQFRLDPVGNGNVGDGAAAVQRDQVAGQFGDCLWSGRSCRWIVRLRCSLAAATPMRRRPRLSSSAVPPTLTRMVPDYIDPRSGATFPLDQPRWCGPNRTPLLLTPLPGLTRSQIDTSTRSLWRYRAAFPFQVDDPITLGEGGTPLIPRTVAGVPVLLKCEWFNPTCSFKDRGASVMLSLLRAQGVDHVLEDSSGNGGAAVAAYAAAGGMAATIMTPASTSPAKTVQMRAHGATVELIPGTRQDTADAAVARSASVFYASHNWHPFFLQGTKTLAYELWEDLGFRAPDNVITPCGAGSNVLGCEIGFSELLRAGQIETLPRIFAAQPANCAPIAAAFMAGSDEAVPTTMLPPLPRAPPSRSRSACGRFWGRCARRAAAR